MRVDALLTGVPMLSFAESVQGRVKAPGLLTVWWPVRRFTVAREVAL